MTSRELKVLTALKWLGVLAIVASAFARCSDFHYADLILSMIGASIWVIVAIRIRDTALMTVYGFIIAMMIYGIVSH
jgi:hypothetical protein